MSKIDFKSALRTSKPMEQLATTSIGEIAAELQPTEAKLVTHKATGNEYLLLMTASGQHISIGQSSKVVLESTSQEDRMAELINNYVIYVGTSDKGGEEKLWFSFGVAAGDYTPTPGVSFASLLAKVKGKVVGA